MANLPLLDRDYLKAAAGLMAGFVLTEVTLKPKAQQLTIQDLTKAALIAMTKSLALALAPNIQVNAIAPGMILPPPGEDRSYLERKAGQIPARRVGSPEEIAKTLIFLLRSDFVTGDLIFVTGGEHL